jgi:hypothetical protein
MLLSLPKIRAYLQWQERNNLDKLVADLCKKKYFSHEGYDDEEGSSREDYKAELINNEKQSFINGIYTNTFQDILRRDNDP